jgi:hypothetical protein
MQLLDVHMFDLYEEIIEQYIYLSLEEYNVFFQMIQNFEEEKTAFDKSLHLLFFTSKKVQDFFGGDLNHIKPRFKDELIFFPTHATTRDGIGFRKCFFSNISFHSC